MSTEAWPAGYGRVVLPSVDSTLDEAARRFDRLNAPTWILALQQTAARGRRGRAWRHPRGNFAATLVLREPAATVETSALRSFAIALALHDSLVAATGRAEAFALKWPNDVLLNGGKVAGILLETVLRQNRFAGLSIGVGVNLAEAPGADQVEAHALRPVSLAGETGARVTPEEFLDLLAPAYARYETQLTTYGFAPLRDAWLARAARLGETVTARLPGEEVTGRFDTVDEAGHLVLSTPKGRRSIAAAEVYF